MEVHVEYTFCSLVFLGAFGTFFMSRLGIQGWSKTPRPRSGMSYGKRRAFPR